MNARPITVSARIDCASLHVDRETRRVLEVTLAAHRPEDRVPSGCRRAAINCALVIDRSGSMAAAGKLDFALEAARYIVEKLDGRDYAALVAFDDTVELVAPSRQMTPQVRRELLSAIAGLRTGNSTDLHGGWLRGAEQVAASLAADRVNRVLLLSDGLANCGLTDPLRIAAQACEMQEARIATSTFGVGEDYDEFLMRSLAEQGGGHYYFIANAREIPGFFQRELGEMATVVARRTTLTVTAPEGTEVSLRGDLPFERRGPSMVHPVGDMFAGEERKLYFRVVTPKAFGAPVDPVAIRVAVHYNDLAGAAHEEIAGAVYTYSQPYRAAKPDEEVRKGYALTTLATSTERALALQNEGRYAEASALVLSELQYRRQDLDEEAIETYTRLAKQMTDRSMTQAERKQSHYDQYKQRNFRK